MGDQEGRGEGEKLTIYLLSLSFCRVCGTSGKTKQRARLKQVSTRVQSEEVTSQAFESG